MQTNFSLSFEKYFSKQKVMTKWVNDPIFTVMGSTETIVNTEPFKRVSFMKLLQRQLFNFNLNIQGVC